MKTIIFLIVSSLCVLANNGWQNIHQAIFEGNMKNIHLILNEKNIKATTKAGLTPLHMAIKIRDLALVKLLVNKGADVDAQDNKGFSPLYYAVMQNQIAIAKFLLDNEADPNLTNTIGNAPLHNIAYNNRFEMLELFMNYDTNFNLRNAYGMLAHEFAQKKGNTSMVTQLKSLQY